MKIIVIGATGTIGSEVVSLLKKDNQLIKVGHSNGDLNIDFESEQSIRNLFEETGKFDALISTAGFAKFGSLNDLTVEDYLYGLQHKLLGQVKLFLYGREFINEQGSFTLTSGMLSDYPMPGSTSISMINGGINSFVKAAALETPKNTRINAVSPGWIKETMEAMGMDSNTGIPAREVAKAYKESLIGQRNGEIINPASLSD
jgi:NAD(P)-dependent dehydrogenase (short-subunit alcohol dehydrogenase family)